MKKHRKIVIVPDKFKGSLSAEEVIAALESSVRERMVGGQDAEIVGIPLSDGGDGFLETVEKYNDSEKIYIDTVDALMRPVKAPLLVSNERCFIEMAKVCGLQMLAPKERNPELTTSYGLGVMICEAVGRGCREIVTGIGGSATNDAGEGMLNALRDRLGEEFKERLPRMTVACDVNNPLLGPNGATMVYAPQKGADAAMLERLERRVEAVAEKEGLDVSAPGGGAAGGVGAAFLSLGAELIPGWSFISQTASLEPQIASADVVITGEGCFDGQSLCGKLVSGVTEICSRYGKKPLVVCGSSKLSKAVWKKAGIADVFSLDEIEGNMEKCISDAGRLVSGRNVLVAGCDEAGRGCLAGPVFAAAVVLPDGFSHPLLNDSKQLTESQRNSLRPVIEKEALAWAVASVDAQEIDKINILNASIKAMHLALDKLSIRPDMVLVDGNRFKPYRDVPSHTVVKGDANVKAIAAASVLAKTYKDEFLRKLAVECPQYGWDHNAGYPTEEHREAIRKYGVSKYHRLSYNLLGNSGELF